MVDTFSVYGPPGCGKTTEMLKRLEEAKNKYSVDEICFLSFTKAGASEALKRLNIKKSEKICTIHSLMFKLNNLSVVSVVDHNKLKKFGDKTGFRFKGTTNDTSENMEIGDQYLSILYKAVNKMVDIKSEYYESNRPGDWHNFKFFCECYDNWKLSNGYCDFNDMLLMYLRNTVDHKSKAVFIDEAQDLSNLQWSVVDKIISFPYVKEVHIAGDDDQSIYEWSGANAHGMQRFENKYDSDRLVLNQSFRVPRSIHEIAIKTVNTIKRRVQKEYLPKTDEGIIRRSSFFNSNLFSSGDDVLILCRNFVTKKEIEEELIRSRVPYSNDSGLPSLFSNRIAEAIKIFKKMENGEALTQPEIDKMLTVSDDRTKKELSTKSFQQVLKRGYMASFVIPIHLVDFYREADFSVIPTVRVSTIHASKGREADHTILHTGLTNKTLLDMDSNPDAEARVWYVGLTRSKRILDIIEGDNGYAV